MRDRSGTPIFGGSAQSQIDESALKKIAEITGGQFYRANDYADLQSIYKRIDSLEKTNVKIKNFTEYVKAIPESPTVVIITEGNGEGAYADALVNPSRGCAYIADAIIEASGTEKNNKQIELKLTRERALDERIANIFISAGIPPHIKGYQFLREAVKQTVRIPEMINNITKELYPAVADKFATSPSKVERAIRHAIEVAWSRGKIENINNIYGIKIFGKGEKPTNGELIALIADKLMIEYS